MSSTTARMTAMTSTIQQWEASVANLWERYDLLDRYEGVAAMRALAERCPAADGRAAFELAGMYDSMGFEAEAGAEYERALRLGLDDNRHAQLAVQYGSTLRNLGRIDEAITVLEAAPTHESTGSAPRVVLALALHSAGRKDEALRVALEAQIDALPRYRRSMRNYAAALTEPADGDTSTAHRNLVSTVQEIVKQGLRVVCLCGSARFRDDMADANQQLTLAGVTVLAPAVFPHGGDAITEEQKANLDALHLRKIDLADAVLVIDPGGYIGESTTREITHAHAAGKPVFRLSST
ncbi:MAG: tetratricopeptide repeat protein [Arachnia sp.]